MSNKDIVALTVRLAKMGFEAHEISALRRIARTLQRWSELECGDSNDFSSWAIERDDETGKPFFCRYPHTSNEAIRQPIADREAAALKRLEKIMSTRPELVSYHQTDPRGASVWIISKNVLNGRDIDSCYSDGVAVY